MKQLHIRLSLIQLFLLVLNLFIFSSALPFSPWFVENTLGWLGILTTTPFLLIISRIMPQLKQSEEFYITITRAVISFIVSIVSLCIILLPTMKFSIVIVLIMNGLTVLITIVYLLQDFWKMNEKYR
ncbi:hypothetical protein [Bacillus toyonensis]|uniref:hypothetical protein n=1 Tax=Bacillus toyonensis TaxID=155322 RepID=UPI000B44F13C|nr:hypothetical protein [Bacillus toyonensis]MED3198016.1 hypothetical protein [Bacillus toyonensis]OTX08887.1 hypothetical protein BK712_07735 [Bacillus thuringiensis serovar seoulensis]